MSSIELQLFPDVPMNDEEIHQIAEWCEAENQWRQRFADCQNRVCRELMAAMVRGEV